MNEVLQKLVMLQDLDFMIAEVGSKEVKRVQKKMGLTIAAHDKLNGAKEMLEQEIPTNILSRYHRLMERYGRAVAPVVENKCMGCCVTVPRSLAVREIGNRELRSCEQCGMFLYWV